ncbi:MAG: hypothetical protein AAGF76_10165 [Pseudomonadota bacterium]
MTVGNGQVTLDGQRFTIVLASGEGLTVDLFDDFLNVAVALDNARAPGSVRGLLGNADGDLTNDFALRSGAPIPSDAIAQVSDGSGGTIPVLDFDFLYQDYAESWRIDANTSLFSYPTGQGTGTFTDQDFPVAAVDLSDLPAELLAAA